MPKPCVVCWCQTYCLNMSEYVESQAGIFSYWRSKLVKTIWWYDSLLENNCFFVAHRNRTCWVPGLRSLIALLLGTLIEPAGSHRDRLKSQEEEESRFQKMFFSGERRGAEASVQETCERLGGGFLCSMDFWPSVGLDNLSVWYWIVVSMMVMVMVVLMMMRMMRRRGGWGCGMVVLMQRRRTRMKTGRWQGCRSWSRRPPPPWLMILSTFQGLSKFQLKLVGLSYPVEAQILKTSQFLDASGGFSESVWGTNYRKPLYLVMKNMTSSHKTSVCRCVYIHTHSLSLYIYIRYNTIQYNVMKYHVCIYNMTWYSIT